MPRFDRRCYDAEAGIELETGGNSSMTASATRKLIIRYYTVRIVSAVCITDASKEEDVLLATKDLVERYIGIVSVCVVEVHRWEHF